jgi:hypothetical protein
MAYSAVTVFPAEVWAATNTFWFFSILKTARFWNVSSSNGKVVAGVMVWKKSSIVEGGVFSTSVKRVFGVGLIIGSYFLIFKYIYFLVFVQ